MNRNLHSSTSAEVIRNRPAFRKRATRHGWGIGLPTDSVPFVEELRPAPAPIEVFKTFSSIPNVIFFDSVRGQGRLSRYSFVAADPFLVLQSRRGEVRLSGSTEVRRIADPFHVLAEELARYSIEQCRDLPPFQGGAAGLFGYDLCHHIERLPRPQLDEFEVPDLHVGFYDVVVAFDHRTDRAWVISTGFPEREPRRRHRRAKERISWAKRKMERGQLRSPFRRTEAMPLPRIQHSMPGHPLLTSSLDRAGYLGAVGRAIEYIRNGDCFQVNVAQRLLYPATLSPIDLYERLRRRNPAPFAGYYDLGDFVIASASPERFVCVEAGEVETRPIKGTRPRGTTLQDDRNLVHELETSAKDRAENIMIVDLLRNDLGRVCRYGSIRVPAVCQVETYEYVHHLVSEVRGRIREGLGAIDLLRAAFPGGSVTGAPKIRAMEIIAELEPTARGPYCGSLGYVDFAGNMDMNILIRTITMGKTWMQFPVGGGIVADSVGQREYDETWHKAEGLLRSILD
jgi:para-aminobenzoate synthetase component 1